MKTKTTFTLLTVILCCALSGCDPVKPVVDAMKEATDKAVALIDNGINQIQNDSTKWQAITQQIAADLPKEIQGTIRTEVDQLAARNIARTGEEFRCNSEFFGQKAVDALRRIKAELLKQPVTPIYPSFCQIVPAEIDLNLDASRRAVVDLSGYDMDHADAKQQLVKAIFYSDETKQTYEFPEARIGRSTHYHIVFNLLGSDIDQTLFQRKISKIKLSWDGHIQDFPQVLVIQKVAQVKTVPSGPLGQLSFYPHLVRGDAEFNTQTGKPLNVEVRGETANYGTEIRGRVYMRAEETGGDHSTAEGWSQWERLYAAPPGYTIRKAIPLGLSKTSVKMMNDGRDPLRLNLGQGEVVNQFSIWGDHGGNDAETYTRVQANFTPLSLELLETTPTVAGHGASHFNR